MGLLTGKTALITGASRGIGKTIATKFAAEGATVAVHYGRSASEAEAVVAEIIANGGKAFAVQADVANVASIEAMFTTLDSKLQDHTGSNQIDILVNNAGVYLSKPIGETTEEDFDFLFNINVKGVYFTTKYAIPRLRDNGRVINVSSGVTRVAFPGASAYAGTKGAVDVFTLQLAAELGERGITVNTLAPGVTETDMTAGLLSGGGDQYVVSLQAIKRVGQAEDIANAAVLLASDQAGWLTANYVDASGGIKL